MGLLADQVIVVTGASEGIGREMVKLFVREGARVAAVARRREVLEALAAEVDGDRVHPLPADVRRLPEMEAAVRQTLERWGRIDALVNNAGVAKYVHLVEMSAEEFQWQLDVNLTGLFNGCKAVLPHLLERARSTDERPAGQILNIGSILGTVGRAGGTAYCATKWGLMGFTESLRLEVQKEGIRVMALCPGQVQTDFAGIAAETKAKALRADTVALQALQMLAAPPDGQPGTVLLRPFHQA
ncbi:MAG: SDR family oxidoreductase [Bacillota bacterium]